jgi:hypothetical protein
MTLRGGVLEEILQIDPDMVEVEIVEKHRLAAYSGTTTWRTARIPEVDDE